MKQPTIRGWSWIIASLAFASLSALVVVSLIALAPHAPVVRQATAPILPLYSAATARERDLRDELAAAYRWVGSDNPAALAELRALRSRPQPPQVARLSAALPERLREPLQRADSLVAIADANIGRAVDAQAAGRRDRALGLLAAASNDRKRVGALMSDVVAASIEESRAVQERMMAAADRARVAIAASVLLAAALLVASVLLMRRRVVRPLARLHADVRAIAAGDLAHRASVGAGDEIGELARDVNQMTAALEERLRQHDRLRAVGELMGGLAHELNNPLQVILARSSHALQSPADEETRESMRLIQEHARRAGRVVAGVLSFVRARPSERVPADVNRIIADTVGLLDDEFRSERVTLQTRLAPDLPPARVDRGQIEQLLVNLLANALHAARSAPVRAVLVETRADADTVVVAVEDSGPGIPPALRPRIFDPFYTGGANGEGGGLGLAISARIANAHTGTLTLASGAGPGTRFELRLPAEAAAPRSPERAPGAAVPGPGGAGGGGEAHGLRLLVADDEDAVRNAWERYFTRLGAHVTTARDGGEALDHIRRGDWDAILLDLKMPVVSGWDVLQATRQERPDLAGRIVVVSGDISSLLDLQTAEHLEPWRMLEKPADLETVGQAVLRAARASRP